MITTRDADWVIGKAFLVAKNKTPAPTSGAKYDALLEIVDSEQKNWADEENIEWDSLYELRNAGTITATDTFPIGGSFSYITKDVRNPIRTSDGTQTNEYKLVSASQLYRNKYGGAVAQVGTNLLFSLAFTSSSTDFGWNLYIPVINEVGDITAGSDIVEVDNPNWLAYATAAEFIRNDLVRQNQYNNILAKQSLLMNKMKEVNGSQNDDVITDFEPLGATWL